MNGDHIAAAVISLIVAAMVVYAVATLISMRREHVTHRTAPTEPVLIHEARHAAGLRKEST